MTCVIPDFIELLDLSEGDHVRTHLIDTLEAQCRALRSYQQPNGMWRTLLDVSEAEGTYEEASATAGFAYGILKAIRKRYIGAEYRDVATKAVKAVFERISEDGELRDVSFGTGMGDTLQHYIDIERTSMPLWAGVGDHSARRVFENLHMIVEYFHDPKGRSGVLPLI